MDKWHGGGYGSFLWPLAAKAAADSSGEPDGPYLADALARFVELERPGPVLELGAGTGSLTRGLVRAGCPLERIIAVEQEPRFGAVLRRDFPGATVIEGANRPISRRPCRAAVHRCLEPAG
jgi:phospholipid N-methyltransferase